MITKKRNSIYVNTKSRHTKSRHTKKNINNIKNKINKAELFILFNIITNHIIVLLNKKQSQSKIKSQIIKLLKVIRKNDKLIKIHTTDKELILLFNTIFKESKLIYENKQNNKHKIETRINNKTDTKNRSKTKTKLNKGGFYFKNIEDKGDQPITGNDMAHLLNEMQDYFYNAQ